MNERTSPRRLPRLPAWAGWLLGLAPVTALAVGLVYYWRVFYSFDRMAAGLFTLLACTVAWALYLAVFLAVRLGRSFAGRAAVCIFVCGALFCFANPPLQAPDETDHYLRSYAISLGRLDFDADRGYPEDVDRLLAAFPGAWVNAHTSVGWGENSQGAEAPYDSSGYALKQWGEDGEVLSVADSFAQYLSGEPAKEKVTEPISLMILPFVPQALGMVLARLIGLGALGCLYAGRLANLACYTLLCWLALRGCRRYQPVFLGVMLLPLSLYMAASLSYDATLLGFYYLVASYYCRDEIRDRDVYAFFAAFVLMNVAKPYINLLWIVLPLILPRRAWKTRWKKWQVALAGLVGAVVVTRFIEWYGVAFRHNYGTIERMIEGVEQLPQLAFILSNPLRYIAVLFGTLYENEFFIGQLGVFGSLDLPIPLLNILCPAVLLFCAALSVHEKSSLRPLPAAGLGALGVVYIAGAMTAMYITYTPVGMVRVIGLQARYFLPVFLMLLVLVAALLSHVLEPKLAGTGKALNVALVTTGGTAVLGAVLLFQHWFIGPVYTIYL
ncbi:DUF2142 domain-containing protein [Gemmiger formicilis]|uniref:DUF2142 domain-containing protein n=1 Tax=Gemmiger formicilis TaxID=745368 RepID=UPI001956B19C|nr:DUF2142 domain-containing protein [Gemmiger formicilis]MBM6914597.1 DUF2142 domain-containing protein [Gemmiger formicilis]